MKNSKEELDQKFLTSGQEKIRLTIALERFFELTEEEEALYNRYLEYLKKRFRPAMECLIENRKNKEAEMLFHLTTVTKIQMEELLHLAGRKQNTAFFVWLLQKKKEMFGFEERNMEL